MKFRRTYKTKSDYQADFENGKLYEGFVIGAGYAYVYTVYEMPGNLNGFGHFTNDYPENNRYSGFRVQLIDSSQDMVALSLQAHTSGTFFEHTVVRGETLSSIAQDFGIHMGDLVRWNNIANPNKITVGQVLLIDADLAKPSRRERLEMKIQTTTDKISTANPAANAGNPSGWVQAQLPMTFLNYGSLIPTTIGGLKYTGDILFIKKGGFWRGGNGQYYKTAQALRASGHGWNFRTNSMNIAKNASVFKYLRWGGFALGGISTLDSGIRFYNNPNWEDGSDTVAGIGGAIYWPIGIAYLAFKLNVKAATSYTKNMMDNGLVPGRDDMMIWKY